MRSIFIFRTIFLVCFAFAIAACGGGSDAKPDASKSAITEETRPGVFRNAYFGITVTKPEGWYALTIEQQEQLLGVGRDLIAGDDASMQRAYDASAKKTSPLFSLSAHEPGSPVIANPSVTGLAENLTFMSGVKTGADYFFHMKNVMKQTEIHYDFGEGYTQHKIGGVDFDAMHITVNFNGRSIKQTYYAARRNNHIITIINTYISDEFKDDTSKILDTIIFE